ncbi:MAG: glycosyltransferase family 4 protein [Gemmataceae bacterium]|nr:glycosyltransferase family 4 protein [Gemmataceae bacterium]MDW8267389.1 glycosyltransferase family 1 protein [Gemmataceae bacterium]
MRVVINRLSAVGQRTGIGHYTSQLLRCLRQQAHGDTIDAFPAGWVVQARAWSARVRRYVPRTEPAAAETRPSLWAQMRCRAFDHLRWRFDNYVARHCKRYYQSRSFDLYHEPNFIPFPSDLPTVTTLHDLSVLLHPEWHPADRVRRFEREFARALSQSCHFLAISEAGRQEIIRTLNVPPDKVTRTYMGVRPGLKPLSEAEVRPVLRRLGLPEQYLLYLGTIEPRKNVLRLMQAYCGLPEAVRRRWPLVLIGSWGWRTADIAEYLHTEARHRGVTYLGYVADDDVPAVYNGARALVYPSYYEGFGLPPVEMLACGGAVLASTAAAVAETVGRQAHLIDPEDTDGWRHALLRVVQDDDWWWSLRRGAVEAVRSFTWEQCAADTLQVYRLLTGASQGPAWRRAG